MSNEGSIAQIRVRTSGYHQTVNLSAFILAGGKSSRMGRDKALLSLHGQTLLDHARQLGRAVTDKIYVVGSRVSFGPQAIEDIFSGRGPLGGIHAALTTGTTEWNLVLAVDTPFVSREFLRFLVDEAERSRTVVTVPYTNDRFQPLCAVYRREFAAVAETALQIGQNKIEPLFCHVTVRRIDEEELKRLAFDPRMFDNLNTPEDFARAQNRP